MNETFLVSFAASPPRETSGSRSSNRFDYQKNWSFCKLLSLHLEGKDYLMIFEHHDDVVVFDSQDNPSFATFYQVKTKKTGHWTIGPLIKSEKGDVTKSILGKLYSNYLNFKDHVNRLVFTSNQNISAKLEIGGKSLDCDLVTFSQLSSSEKERIQKAVEGTEQNYCDFVGLSKLVVHKTDLRLEDHTAITKGKLVEFFERLHPEKPVHIAVVYKTIFDEIRRKTNNEHGCSNVPELRAKKGVDRSEFEKMIRVVLQYRTPEDLWTEAHQLLCAEGYGALKIRQLRSDWQLYAVDRMDVNNEPLIQIRSSICSKINDLERSGFGSGLKDLTSAVLIQVKNNYGAECYSDSYMEAAILYEVTNNDPVSQVSAKSTEKTI